MVPPLANIASAAGEGVSALPAALIVPELADVSVAAGKGVSAPSVVLTIPELADIPVATGECYSALPIGLVAPELADIPSAIGVGETALPVALVASELADVPVAAGEGIRAMAHMPRNTLVCWAGRQTALGEDRHREKHEQPSRQNQQHSITKRTSGHFFRLIRDQVYSIFIIPSSEITPVPRLFAEA